MCIRDRSSTSSLSLYNKTDALNNIYGAIDAAYAGIKEVGVYFHHHLFRGNRSLKTNTHAFDAFSSPNYAFLGQHDLSFSMNSASSHLVANRHDVALSQPENLAALKNQLVKISQCIDENIVINIAAYPMFYSQQSNILAHTLAVQCRYPMSKALFCSLMVLSLIHISEPTRPY